MLTTLIDGTPRLRTSDPNVSTSLLHGHSPATSSLQARLRSLAPHYRTALITGEAGVGKRRVARQIHRLSRPEGAFLLHRPGQRTFSASLSVSCTETGPIEGMWRELLESAQGGTLVIEEVGDLSSSDQECLLRLLREPGWRNAGCARPQVIGISRSEPRVLLTSGRLRQDLHMAFSAVDIRVQPLRNRPEDVEALAREFLAEAAGEFGLLESQVSPETVTALQSRPWPGNVAELRSVVRQALVGRGESVLTMSADEPAPAPSSEIPPARTSMSLQDALDSHVCKVLAMCGGNKLKTAELLGVSRSTLYRMLEGLSRGPQ